MFDVWLTRKQFFIEKLFIARTVERFCHSNQLIGNEWWIDRYMNKSLSYENLIEMFLCYFISVLINNAIHLSILFYLIFFSDADHRGINFLFSNEWLNLAMFAILFACDLYHYPPSCKKKSMKDFY
ncbi:hypothetical protein DERF_003288 [Dermatophagoides farinae]|uniref:Uncharacterized protein n=1 Tax=Dermatophagoides farinae TaxID=6954 RepID=A0A922IF86_DERFA|nr:hypothetical protein DERF_003288 [Dermatophagoides farinae]